MTIITPSQDVNSIANLAPQFYQLISGEKTSPRYAIHDVDTIDFLELLRGSGWQLKIEPDILLVSAPDASNVTIFRPKDGGVS